MNESKKVITKYSINKLVNTYILIQNFLCTQKQLIIYNTYSNMLVGIIHHSNKHIEKHHQRDYVVGPKHCGAHKFCELVVSLDISHIQTDQSKN